MRKTAERIFMHCKDLSADTTVRDLICKPYEEASENRENRTVMLPSAAKRRTVVRPRVPLETRPPAKPNFVKKLLIGTGVTTGGVVSVGVLISIFLGAFYYGYTKTRGDDAEETPTTDTGVDKNAIGEEKRQELIGLMDLAGQYYLPVAQDVVRASDTFVMTKDGTVYKNPTDEQKQVAIDELADMFARLSEHMRSGRISLYTEHHGEARDLGYGVSVARWNNAGTPDDPTDDTLKINRAFFDRQRYKQGTFFHEYGHAYSGGGSHEDNIEDLDRSSAAFSNKVEKNRDYSYYLTTLFKVPDDIMRFHIHEMHNSGSNKYFLPDNQRKLSVWQNNMAEYVDGSCHDLQYLGITHKEIEKIIKDNNLWKLMNELMKFEVNDPEGEFYKENKSPVPSELKKRPK